MNCQDVPCPENGQPQCNHSTLVKLGGPIHPSGKDYYCPVCGEQFKAEIWEVGIQFGTKIVKAQTRLDKNLEIPV
jgi:hypothetical protein